MLVKSDRIIPITKLQKQLTNAIRDISASGEALYILKNNNMEAVIIPFEDYEYLTNLEEMFEYFEIQNMLENRIKEYDSKNSIDWSAIKEE